MDARMYGTVSTILERTGRGVIVAKGPSGGLFAINFFLHETAEPLMVGDRVSFLAGLYKAIDVRKENALPENVVRVDFRNRKRVTT